MKRRIQLIRVLTAAAVLSAGLSMTSYAEEGWAEENGGWAYYDAEGKRVTDRLLELDGNYYYIGEDGLMVSNQWVAIDNENADPDELMYEDEPWIGSPYEEDFEMSGLPDEPRQYWYYFQDNGKAYKGSGSSSVTRTKEINGKKYAFDDEGRMLYGWVLDGERLTGEDAWMEGEYYFGEEDDGAMKLGWQKLRIFTDPDNEVLPDDGIWEDEMQDRWFYFSETGKKKKGKENRIGRLTLYGQKYGFDEYGRMISSWYADPTLITTEVYDKTLGADVNREERQGGEDYSREFMYFGSPESGAKYTKGWFRARPSRYLMESKHEDGETYMYYADGSGNLCVNEIRTIGGEKYAFDNYGRQIRGIVCLTMEDETTSSKIESTWYQDKTDREFSSFEAFNDLIDYERYNSRGDLVECYQQEFDSRKRRFYYFNGKDGAMLTGTHMVTLGDEKFEFAFEDDGRLKGSGLFGKKDGKLYQAGMLMKPEEGQKYAIVRVEDKEQKVGMNVEHFQTLDIMSVRDFIAEVCNSGIYDEERDETVWTVRYEPEHVEYYLVSQNGKIVKNKKRATDDDGYQFYVKNNKIKSITVEE
ncbi:MAG: cell wall-binding protein [Eubacteriales bacterium]|nr:cell wall-binding protein [Eubacteriales bacterium]